MLFLISFFESGLTKNYWGDAVLTTNYLRNRSPSKALPTDKTPYELWFQHPPRMSHLRIFGSPAFARVTDDLRTKLDVSFWDTVMTVRASV